MINNARLIEFALRGLEAERERIEGEIDGLRQQLAAGRSRRQTIKESRGSVRAPKKGLTTAGRKRLSDLMKARWAARRAPQAGRRKSA